MGQRYEYVAVDLPRGAPKGTRLDDVISEKLNGVAAHGWRLVTVYPAGQYGGGHALFERPVGGSDG